MAVIVETEQVLAAKFEVLFPHLDERQRLLLMGAEARTLGRGGIRAVARAAGVAENTVWAAALIPDSRLKGFLRCELPVQVLVVDLNRDPVAEP